MRPLAGTHESPASSPSALQPVVTFGVAATEESEELGVGVKGGAEKVPEWKLEGEKGQ